MLHDVIFLLMGLALLILGGNWVTDGGTALARRLHMSGLMVGLTIVAFGSAAPDLAVGIMSTVSHKPEMAIGDVVGADIFDFLLVIGAVAIISPITVTRCTLRGDFPVAALAAWLIFILADDILIDGAASNGLNRSDGLVMLMALGVFLAYTLTGKPGQGSCPGSDGSDGSDGVRPMPLWLSLVMLGGGLGGVVIGANWFVDGASGIAYRAGWSEGLVGLTIVAIGSSLPDLFTSVIAAIKKQPGLALGNVIGACIFDSLLVLGCCSTIAPLRGDTITVLDFGALVVGATAPWLMALLNRRRRIGRLEGTLLVLAYAGYMALLVSTH